MKFGWTILPHPPYPPDLGLLSHLQSHLNGKDFQTRDDIKSALEQLFKGQSPAIWSKGNHDLRKRWQKTIDANGAYFKRFTAVFFVYALDTTKTKERPLPYENFSAVRDAAFITGGNILFGDLDGDGNVRKLGRSTPSDIKAFPEMLSSTTTLTLHANHQVGNVAITVDSGAKGYAFVSKAATKQIRVTNAIGIPLDPINVGRLTTVYELIGNTKYSVLSKDQADYAISVVILNGLTPSFTIVDKGTDIANTALISPKTRGYSAFH
ncbi:hypothetical protein ANCDUO_24390 [Ancylostoma duodenale]|uniref:Uncharacterized protein n=1 Tax=Ancylostoma duodenale TaxID=51022 RepID=A0A0C2FAK1_9BILA|nr:hypothetical protein ANCDUO_24390 [Ancylostoma duodenale]